MASAGSGHAGIYNSRSGLPTFGNFGNTLLERSNPGLRRSTPDSEALASSDEEVEHSRLRSMTQKTSNPIRRPSVLADQSHDSRRLSFAGNNAHSPGPGSQPNTPGTTHENWSTISPSLGAWNGASAYPFGTNIWGASSRDPPARLQEVRNDSESRLPYSSTMQPNSAVQRSMSFSVGQSEHDMSSPAIDTPFSSGIPGLTRRTSRPSGLGQDFGSLSRVNESEGGSFYPTTSSQQATQLKPQSRAFSSTSTHLNSSTLHNHPSLLRTTSSNSAFRNPRFTSSLLEGSEVAIDDTEDMMASSGFASRNAPSRRASDYQIIPTRQPTIPTSANSVFGNSRNTLHWSSNLGFGNLDPIPQSRRHSFADIPTRRGSLDTHEEDEQSYENDSQGGVAIMPDSTYFNPNDVSRRVTEQEVQRQIQQEHHQAIFGTVGPYGIPTNSASAIGSFHGPNSAPLYIVNFKCCRSDIFYIPEDTGLTVKDGDLVIVEADRGTDLGCVQHCNVTLDVARKYKSKYAEQHFSWLMMFSSQTRANGGNPTSNTNLFNPNAVVQGGKYGYQGTAIRESDLKPKMIKRLAQPHEVQALQEKEGNEAKAKRVCCQKVIEHGLHMEVLDAEFQMDGKKLTFYFFSTEYVNFNGLVTDLFKMYKTRIWMSAINPASFQSPVSQLGITPIYGSNTGLALQNIYDTATAAAASRDDYRYGAPQGMNMALLPPARAAGMLPPLYIGGYGQLPPQMMTSPPPPGDYDLAQGTYGGYQQHDPFSPTPSYNVNHGNGNIGMTATPTSSSRRSDRDRNGGGGGSSSGGGRTPSSFSGAFGGLSLRN